MAETSTPPRAPRQDGLRNRDLLLAAAQEIFAKTGPTAPLNAIARRAGVGQASLYRHFPTRGDLVLALLERCTIRVEQVAGQLGDRDDAFAQLLALLIREAVSDIALLSLLDHTEPTSELDDLAARLIMAFSRPLAAAQRAGTADPKLRASDVLLILRLLEGAIRGVPQAKRMSRVERALWLIGSGARIPDISLTGAELSCGRT
jgi:AcrR family transcriptional regulator